MALKYSENNSFVSNPPSRTKYTSIIDSLYDIWQCNSLGPHKRQQDEAREDLPTSQSEDDDLTESEPIVDPEVAPNVDDDLSVGSQSISSAVSGQDDKDDKFSFSLKYLLSQSAKSPIFMSTDRCDNYEPDARLNETLAPLLTVRVHSSSSNSTVTKSRVTHRRNSMALLYAATVKGKYHKTTADRLIILGEEHFQQKEYERSLECFDRAHNIYVAKIGEDALESIETKVKVAAALVALMRPDDAMSKFSLARQMSLAVLTGAQADLQIAFLSLEIGNIQREKGMHAEALKLTKQALRLYKKQHGELHVTVAKAAFEIGKLQHLMGQLSKAVSVYTQVLKIQVGLWGKMHPAVADTLLQLAIIYDEMGDISRSMKITKKSFLIYSATVEENHLSVACVLCHFGNLYAKIGNHSKAFKAYGRALNIRRKLLGRNHQLNADTVIEISNIFRAVGEPQQAILCMIEALDIYRKALGENHTTVSDVLNVMGMTYYDMGDCDKAIKMYSQALNVRINAVGESHPSVANALNNIGTVHSRTKDFQKALISYNSALKIYEMLPTPDHLKYCVTLVNVGTVLRGVGDFEKAEQVFRKALDVCFDNAMLDEAHPVVQKARRSLKAMDAAPYRNSEPWKFSG